MKIFSPICLATGLTIIVCWGCSKQNVGWKKFTSQEGEFSVLFPGTPKQAVINFNLRALRTVSFEESKTTAYIVAYGDVPKHLTKQQVDKFYDDALDAVIANGGKLLQKKSIMFGKISGQELELDENNGEDFGVVRFFLAKDRLYQVIVVEPKENRFSTNILYFLNSFSLLNEK